MRIGITGASGFLGKQMIRAAHDQGHSVTGFSRNPAKPIAGCQEVRGFGPQMDVKEIDALIHLAGESILGLWTPKKQARILESRIEGTGWVVEAIKRASRKPSVLVSASGAGIYGDRGEEELSELSSVSQSGFLARVASVWEAAGNRAEGVRFVAIRIPLILGKGGGAMPLLEPLFRSGLGGKLGTGRQWMPWIHVSDVVGLFFHAAETTAIFGPVNAVTPNRVRNEEFTQIFGEIVKRPTLIPAPAFLLRTILREESALLLDSQNIISLKTLATGYKFRFPKLSAALGDILA
jgi:uncharacterized protein (TIGR01777 family)